jgi:hypothetical protein
MKTPENNGAAPPSKFVEIDFPPEVENDWCASFTEEHGEANLRLMLQAPYYIARREFGTCSVPAPGNQWERVWLSDPQSDGLWVDGEVVGARIVPVLDPEDDFFQYIPHAVMKDVTLVNDSMELCDDPSTEIWVPIQAPGNKLVGYR